MHFITSALSALALAAAVTAAPQLTTPSDPVVKPACTNSAADRSCWGEYDLSTNYYEEAPDTGVVREYFIELVNTTASLDGVERVVLLANGTFPGPTLFADWGDTVRVTFLNSLADNGTSIHFHGIRQNMTNQHDGVASITQCPTAPGDSITYEWRATQYGSTWYHSHYALQAYEGVLGGIIINGPASSNYDNDAGVLFLNDWTHATTSATYIEAQTQGPPTLNNGLINGTNTFEGLGSRFEMDFVAGQSYRLRLINGAVDSVFKFSIDNHTMTVISNDLVPIVPYTTDIITMTMGQRYDVIVTATASSGDFWMRAIPQTSCSENANPNDIKGIVRYDPASTAEPTTTGWEYVDACNDELMTNLVPFLKVDAELGALAEDAAISVGRVESETYGKVFKWFLSATTFVAEWHDPTLAQVLNGNTTWEENQHVIVLPDANVWTYFIIESSNGDPHPIHLHGHDFFILAQGTGTYASAKPTLTLQNAPRRDVAALPGGGYLVIAFITDNPGAWLMHCHIGWHASEGFALQIVERAAEVPAISNATTLEDTCSKWNDYVAISGLVDEDSGI